MSEPHDLDAIAREVLDRAVEGYQIVDRDYRYLYLNDACVRQARKPREALLGRTMMESYPGIESTPLFPVLRKSMTQRVIQYLDHEFTFPNGDKSWFALRLQPVPQGVLICSTDNSERARIEQEVLRARRVLRVIGDVNQAVVGAADYTSFMQEVCRTVVERGGYRLAWIGMKQHDAARSVTVAAVAGVDDGYTAALEVSWGDSPSGQGPTGRAIRSGNVVHSRFIASDPSFEPWRKRASERGYASSICLPYRLDGKVAGVLCIYSGEPDAFDDQETRLLGEVALNLGHGLQSLYTRALAQAQTELAVRTQGELTEAETRYRTLVESLEDLVFSIGPDGRFQYVSSSISKYGYTVAQVVGEHFSRFVHCEDREAVQAALDQTLAGAVEPIVYRVHEKDGREHTVRTSTRAVVRSDGSVVVAGVMVDITELKRTEEQLQVAQRMEAVGQLAGGVAHDFNNLLSVILSYATFVGEVVQDAQARADVEEITKAATRAAGLTRQLLAFSRKQVLEPQVLELNRLASDLEKMLRRLIGEDVELVQRFASELGRVKADPGQLEQVIMNLVVNARDAMPEGGTLTIETANLQSDDEYVTSNVTLQPGAYVVLTVSDTGSGMDETTQQRLFEPFFTTKEVGKGTGLGLSTVYGIVKQSGGSIGFDSQLGIGTVFRVYLPRVKEATSVAPPPAEARSSHGTETILVVEDDQAVRNIAARVLRGAGYQVLTAKDGQEALLVLETKANDIDLVLTDVVMPQMSGKQLAERLFAMRPDMPVVFMSGYTDNMIERHGVLEPGTLLISKPFSAGELGTKVRAALDAPRRVGADAQHNA